MESCNSAPKVPVLHVKTTGPIETSNSDDNRAVLHAQNNRFCVGPIETCYSAPKVAVLHPKATHEGFCMKKPEKRGGTHRDRLFGCKSRYIACTKRHIMSGAHIDLLFGSKSRCFASKSHTWGLGPIETSNSDVNPAVLQAQKDRWGLGPIETCNSGPKIDVLHEKNRDKGWDPWREVIRMQISLYCMHKTTYNVWDTYRFVIRVQKSLFYTQKPQMRAGTHRD